MNDLAKHVAALSLFENWCKTNGVSSLPAAPATVAAFAAACEALGFGEVLKC